MQRKKEKFGLGLPTRHPEAFDLIVKYLKMVQMDDNHLPKANLLLAFHARGKPFHMVHLLHQRQKPTQLLYGAELEME